MDKHNIDRLAVCSTKSIFLDWIEGNQDVLNMAKQYPNRFIPFVTLGPVEDIDFVAKLKEYIDQGIRGLRLYPRFHGYVLNVNPDVIKLLEAINKNRLMICFPLRLIMNWGLPVEDLGGLSFLIRYCPHCTIVVSGVNYGETMDLLPLLIDNKKIVPGGFYSKIQQFSERSISINLFIITPHHIFNLQRLEHINFTALREVDPPAG